MLGVSVHDNPCRSAMQNSDKVSPSRAISISSSLHLVGTADPVLRENCIVTTIIIRKNLATQSIIHNYILVRKIVECISFVR